MKKTVMIIALVFSIVLSLCVKLDYDYPTDQLIRFHVLANSDSPEDQALKLKVKDKIITYMEKEFAQSETIDQSRQILLQNMDAIKTLAQTTLQEAGSDYTVDLQYGNFNFPVKYYGKFSLPAGNYEALRVIIGEGAGQNWWCVLFPPMCFVDAGEVTGDELNKYTDQEPEKKVILKWRVAELWQ